MHKVVNLKNHLDNVVNHFTKNNLKKKICRQLYKTIRFLIDGDIIKTNVILLRKWSKSLLVEEDYKCYCGLLYKFL